MDSQEVDTIPVMLFQPTNSQRQSQDEKPHAPQRWRRIPSKQLLVIVFEIEPACNGQLESLFVGQFHNIDTKVYAWLEVEGMGHYRWLLGPINQLPREQHLEFIAVVMQQIFIFLH